MVRARQAVITEPFKTAVREVELADPAPNQILIAAEWSAISAGTELAVYTGTVLPQLTPVASADPVAPDGKSSTLTFNAVAGTTYMIALAGDGGTAGLYTLNGILAALYSRDGTDWAFDIATRIAPGNPAAWDMTTVVGAAFARYVREASDYAGGKRIVEE